MTAHELAAALAPLFLGLITAVASGALLIWLGLARISDDLRRITDQEEEP